MKNKKILLILMLIIGLIASLLVSAFSSNLQLMQTKVLPVFWLFTATISYLITRDYRIRTKKNDDKIKTIIIIMMFYYIIYFSMGIVLGFEHSPFLFNLKNIFRNILIFISVITFIEIVRANIVKSVKMNSFYFILISILLFLTNTNVFIILTTTKGVEPIIKSLFDFILPMLINSFLLTYLSKNGGFKLSLSYALLLNIILYISPIFPALNWFISFTFKVVLAFIVYIFISIYKGDKRVEEKRSIKKKKLKGNLAFLVGMTFFVLFVIGFFRYMPIAVMSNSMNPEFARGDLIVIEKIEGLKTIEKNSIIMYSLDSSYVVHRVIDIVETPYGKQYITKGDNNNAIDVEPVSFKQIKGIVHFRIKYVGFPSVWVSELIKKPAPNVEM